MLHFILDCLECGVRTGPTDADSVIYDLSELTCRECHGRRLRLTVLPGRTQYVADFMPVWTPPTPAPIPPQYVTEGGASWGLDRTIKTLLGRDDDQSPIVPYDDGRDKIR